MPKSQEALLAIVDANIESFKTYTSEHAKSVLAEYVAGRAAAVQAFEGLRSWSEVPYRVTQHLQAMPDWATRGT
jgi:4'-phosphopantetheinyl transferase EntD